MRKRLVLFYVSYGHQLLENCNIYIFKIILYWLFNVKQSTFHSFVRVVFVLLGVKVNLNHSCFLRILTELHSKSSLKYPYFTLKWVFSPPSGSLQEWNGWQNEWFSLFYNKRVGPMFLKNICKEAEKYSIHVQQCSYTWCCTTHGQIYPYIKNLFS